jgi:hypothetical protein
MPLRIPDSASTLLIRRNAFESAGLARADIDSLLNLTDEEFRVEGDVIAVGPIFDAEALGAFLAQLEERGLTFFDDFFELSGNWPDWVAIFAMASPSK